MKNTIVSCGKISIKHILGVIFVFFATIPWVSFSTNSMDTQPWFIIFGLLFVTFIPKIRIERKVLIVFPCFILVVSMLFFKEWCFDFISARAVISYLSFIMVFFGFYMYVVLYGFPWKIIIFSNAIWLVAAVLQVLYGKEVISFLVLSRTTGTRGVTSLAVEPAYFGLFLFFVNWLYLIAAKYRMSLGMYFLLFINILFIVFFSQSFMVLLFLFVATFFLFLVFLIRGKIHLAMILAISILAVCLLVNLMPGTRIFSLYKKMFLFDFRELAFIDASINQRLADVVFPIRGFFENHGLPGGFHSYSSMYTHLVDEYKGFFWFGGGSNKIMSFLGAFIYELGLFGVLFLGFLFYLFFDGTGKRFFELVFLSIILNSAIPVAFPLVAMIFSMLLLTKYQSKPTL